MYSDVLNRRMLFLGVTVSILFHLGLGLLFMYIFVDASITEIEFAEVTFSSIFPTEQSDVIQSRNITAPSPSQAQRRTSQASPVDLANRLMLEEERPKLLEDIKDKVQAEETIANVGEQANPLTGSAMESQVRPVDRVTSGQELPSARRIDVGEKVSTDIPTEGIGGPQISKKPYDIRWEGGERNALADPLPQFPEGINREVLLRMRITVLPDGTMGEIIPLQKGDATLESVTIQALKKWRFNSLESSAPQINQTGTITFRFILK